MKSENEKWKLKRSIQILPAKTKKKKQGSFSSLSQKVLLLNFEILVTKEVRAS